MPQRAELRSAGVLRHDARRLQPRDQPAADGACVCAVEGRIRLLAGGNRGARRLHCGRRQSRAQPRAIEIIGAARTGAAAASGECGGIARAAPLRGAIQSTRLGRTT